jgi:hypothetical protein
MSKQITLNIEPELYKHLEIRFKGNEQGMKQFIVDAIRNHLSEAPLKEAPNKKDDLESYLKQGSSGSRSYGIKGQGW